MRKTLRNILLGGAVLAGVGFGYVPQVTNDIKLKTYQQGVNGYSGTIDTIISEKNPNSVYDTTTNLFANSVSGDRSQTLIRFDEVELPKSPVKKAILELFVSNIRGGESLVVHDMLKPFTTDATWNSFGDGIQYDEKEASKNPVYSRFSIPPRTLWIDVTDSVKKWQKGGKNNGWFS